MNQRENCILIVKCWKNGQNKNKHDILSNIVITTFQSAHAASFPSRRLTYDNGFISSICNCVCRYFAGNKYLMPGDRRLRFKCLRSLPPVKWEIIMPDVHIKSVPYGQYHLKEILYRSNRSLFRYVRHPAAPRHHAAVQTARRGGHWMRRGGTAVFW